MKVQAQKTHHPFRYFSRGVKHSVFFVLVDADRGQEGVMDAELKRYLDETRIHATSDPTPGHIAGLHRWSDVQRLACGYVYALGECRFSCMADFDVVFPLAKVHRLIVFDRARVRPVDEDFGVSGFAVNLHCSGVVIGRVETVVTRPAVRTINAIAKRWRSDKHTNRSRSTERGERYEHAGKQQSNLFHTSQTFRPPKVHSVGHN